MDSLPINKINLLPGKEYPQKDEEETAYAIVKLLQGQMLRMYENKAKQKRQIHPKMNGCVKAEFIIEKNLPEELKVGLFKEEKSFPAWIRFSNGNTKPLDDRKKDIRGFAIKIMNVPGEKIVESKPGGNLDFILMNTKTFVSRHVNDFYSILKVVTVPYRPGSFFPKLYSVIKNVPILMRAGKAKIKCNHPFELNYYSTVPFRFGDETRAVKYAVIPSPKNELKFIQKKNKDFLKHNMAETLAHHEIVYDFLIQFQTDAEKMPIEDPSVEWESPFIKMATIRIPVQKFDTTEQNEFGDNLSFNSWHTLPEHRPLGNFNRVRKIIYEEMSAFRHLHNHIKESEPEANDDFFKDTNMIQNGQHKPANY